jgi:MFS transporter, DHA1 family, multidrug resistance protein
MTAARRLELMVLLGVLTAFAPLSIDMYLPALPALETYFKATEGAVQLTLAMFIVGFSLGQTLYGPLTDRFGRKPPLYIGMMVYTLSSGACALAASVGQLTALRLLQSLGACAGSVISRAMVRDLFPPEETRRVYSALILVMGVSPLLAPLFGAYMLLWFGWKAIFLSVMIVGALATIGMYFRLPETLPAARPISFGYIVATYGALLKDRHFLGATLATGFSSAGMFAYIAGSPFIFINLFGVRPDRFSWFFGLNAAAVVIGAQVNGRMLHGHAPEKVMRYAAFVQAFAGTLLIAAVSLGTKSLLSIAFPLFIYLCTIGFVFPNAVALALANHGKVAGMASALLGTLQFSMAAAALLALGAIDSTTPFPMSVLICLCGVMGVAMHLLLMR